MIKKVIGLLLVAASLLLPTQASACAYAPCEYVLINPLLTTINTTLGTILASVNLTNQEITLMDNDVSEQIAGLHTDMMSSSAQQMAQSNAFNHEMIEQAPATAARQRAMQDATEQFGLSVPADACSLAQEVETFGKGLASQTNYFRFLAQATDTHLQSMATSSDPYKRLVAQVVQQETPQMALSPAGTMNPTSLGYAHDYLMNVLAPAPPPNPKNLPARLQGLPQAQQYQSIYTLYKGNEDLYAKIAGRNLELMSPSIVAQQSQINTWNQFAGNAPTNWSTDPNYPDERSTLVPVVQGGVPYISEIDYIRTQLFERYANPDWAGSTLNGMTEKGVLEEIAQIDVLNARMLYELMLGQQSQNWMLAMSTSHQMTGTYAEQLRNLRAQMEHGG